MLEIPPSLETYRTAFEKTIVPYISLTVTEKKPSIYSSKFGGDPYLPLNIDHPLDASGNPLHLLAQLNFSELPPLTPFPQQGMLQFYISMTDEVYGIDFEEPTNQANFRVLYHPEIIEDDSKRVTDFSYIQTIHETHEDYSSPLYKEYCLLAHVEEEAISNGDYRFQSLIPEMNDDEEEDMMDVLGNDGHKIGGYAFFTQEDPRTYLPEGSYDVLLFQMDSIDGICWGDMGVGNFFISASDLQALNFTNVLYNWDCY
ncbi:YwqG-like protein [Fictibacillus macauensis ZFHKF-1]|uniref:YwqG-like protein n=1 Tax=Fictibacillus macauensis ZFHKF-1 TaxID=1196324 RepID=I8J4K8_9BACL|nr:YwqG family protein [Fictibacillus macauensis]EIT86711.1 YwqG-like protein [Fictibacillus macauensis ZFHKF-1]